MPNRAREFSDDTAWNHGEPKRILLIESDPFSSHAVSRELALLNYQVVLAENREDTGRALRAQRFDLAVVSQDLSECLLPEMNDLPVLMLGRKDSSEHFQRALEAGAAGWLGKPFSLLELRSWLACLERKRPQPALTELAYGDVRLNLMASECWINQVRVKITRQELAILRVFVEHPDRTIPAMTIWDHVWGLKRPMDANLIHVYIGRLRSLLLSHSPSTRIVTSRGRGYTLHGARPPGANPPPNPVAMQLDQAGPARR